ncbi:MAG: hypothetical protein KY461_02005 [Actinobacteria bacterium]|nr:hypothetical protein [Actinomycetota bacterium]
MDLPFLLLLVLGGAVAAGLAWWQHHQKAKRREALFALAKRYGLTYTRVDAIGVGSLPFRFLRRGDDRGVENVITGTLDGRPVALFDLWVMHETRDSKGHRSRRYEHFTCGTAIVDDAWWPGMTLKPESALTRIGGAVGMRDLQFESDDFNRSWHVTCRDQRLAYAFVDARMMQWLLMAGTEFRFDVFGSHVLAICDRLEPSSWLTLHHALAQFVERIPPVARELYPLPD